MTNSKRLSYLDYTKGFAILCMLLSHSIPDENNIIRTIISGFDMPVFFVICGCLIALKQNNSFDFNKQYLIRRIKSIFIPYLLFSTLLAIFYCSLSFISGQEIEWCHYLVKIVTLQGVDSLWFLPVYLFSELLFVALLRFNRYIRISLLIISILLLFVFYILIPEFEAFKIVIRIIVDFIFPYFGYIIFKYDLHNKVKLPVSIFIILLGTILSVINGSVDMATLQLNNALLYFINAFLISFGLLSVFSSFEKHHIELKFLKFWGSSTIVVLCTNNIVIEIVRLVDHIVTKDILINSGDFGNIIFFIIITLIEFLIIKLFYNRFSFLFGKR